MESNNLHTATVTIGGKQVVFYFDNKNVQGVLDMILKVADKRKVVS